VLSNAKAGAKSRIEALSPPVVQCICALPTKKLRMVAIEVMFTRMWTVLTETCHFLSSQAIYARPDKLSCLESLCSQPVPQNMDLQFDYISSTHKALSAIAQAGFDSSTTESAYESQIYPAMVSTLLARPDIDVIKRLYHILYRRVQGEIADVSNTIISWMQPPQPMLETAMYGLADLIVTQYQGMIDSVLTNQLNEEGMNDISKNKLWPKRHAIVVGLRCEISEFCELFWRIFRNNLTGEFLFHPVTRTRLSRWMCSSCMRT
jgi:hypothetical protein